MFDSKGRPSMTGTVWIWAARALVVSSAPVLNTTTRPDRVCASATEHPLFQRKISQNGDFGETGTSRTAYVVISMFCMSLIAGMLGHRIRWTDPHRLKSLSLTYALVYVLYFFSMSFVLSAAVVISGVGLRSPKVCRGTAFVCLTFYFCSKMTMYLFLIERAHVLRAPYMRRSRDGLWLIGTSIIVAVFGTIAVLGFVGTTGYISSMDGRCRLGLPRYVTIPLVSFDVIINILLTLVFVYLLSPSVRASYLPSAAFPASRFMECLGSLCSRSGAENMVDLRLANQSRAKRIERLLWRTFIGSCLVLVPTVGNMASLTTLGGKELRWVCLTVCSCDVTWTVCVIHWLTSGSSDVEEKASVALVPDIPFTSDASSVTIVERDQRY